MKIEIPLTEQELQNEIWKPLRDTNYEFSNLGRVRNIKSKRILKQYKNNTGYLYFSLSYKGKISNTKTHRAMYEAFNPNFDPKDKNINVHHIDDNIWNNRLENLQEISRREHFSFHKTKEKNPRYKGPLARFELDGTFVGLSNGKYELKELGFCQRTPYLVANKILKRHENHIFRWHDRRMILIKGVKYDVDNLPNKASNHQLNLF